MNYSERLQHLQDFVRFDDVEEYFGRGQSIKAFTEIMNGNVTVVGIEIRSRENSAVEQIQFDTVDGYFHTHRHKEEVVETSIIDARLRGVLDYVYQQADRVLDDPTFSSHLLFTFIPCDQLI